MMDEKHYFKLHIDPHEGNHESEEDNLSPATSDPKSSISIEPAALAGDKPAHNLKPQNVEAQPVPNTITQKQYHTLQQKSIRQVKVDKSRPSQLKLALKDGLHQLAVSAVFLVIGFILLNWSALSQFAGHYYRQWTGQNENTPLTDLVENIQDPTSQDPLLISENTDPLLQQYQEIPDLDLEITPLDDRIIIPRITQNIPVVRVSTESLIRRDWAALESEMQLALQDGVVHYPGTSLPGQRGNVVITGHSSYFPWDPGRFKDVFALLHDVEVSDKIVMYYKQDKYTYEVTETKVVLPDNLDVLKQTPEDKLTLITCTPVGTNLKRLIVIAKPIAINDQLIQS